MGESKNPARGSFLREKPEELIRQSLIDYMVHSLGFCLDLFVIEKGIDKLPFVKGGPLNARRVDLLYLSKGLHPTWPLSPLILIECKAGPLNPAALEQVMGYNYRIDAPFIALANGQEIRTFWLEKKLTLPFLPNCQELLHAVRTTH